MPVRNFFVHAEVDGKKEPVRTGPRTTGGGMSIIVYQRNGGAITVALTVGCVAEPDGTLITTVCSHRGEVVLVKGTKR